MGLNKEKKKKGKGAYRDLLAPSKQSLSSPGDTASLGALSLISLSALRRGTKKNVYVLLYAKSTHTSGYDNNDRRHTARNSAKCPGNLYTERTLEGRTLLGLVLSKWAKEEYGVVGSTYNREKTYKDVGFKIFTTGLSEED